jgi:hypothetical protein
MIPAVAKLLSEDSSDHGGCGQIVYFGKTADLASARNHFSKDLRSSFRDLEADSPVKPSELEAFWEFVVEYVKG